MKNWIIIFVFTLSTLLGRKLTVKLATLAPEGTHVHSMLLEIGQEWKSLTKGKVRMKIYAGGIVGDERDMVRKMRIGQIHAAAMTSEGLSEIVPQFAGFFIPLIFQTYQDIDKVKNALLPDLKNKMDGQGFKLFNLNDFGWVYWFSAEEISVPKDLMDAKIYTTAGDYVTVELFKKFGFNAVPVSETDILTSLQTGMITSMQTVPILSLSSGWSALMPNMLDLKWGAFVGAVIVDERVWKKIKPEHQKIMMDIATDIGQKYQKSGREMEKKAIDVMQQYGMKIKQPSEEEIAVWNDFKDEITPDVVETFLSTDIYEKVISAINE